MFFAHLPSSPPSWIDSNVIESNCLHTVLSGAVLVWSKRARQLVTSDVDWVWGFWVQSKCWSWTYLKIRLDLIVFASENHKEEDWFSACRISLRVHINTFAFSTIPEYRRTGSGNRFSWKTRTRLSYTVNLMVYNGLATKGARASVETIWAVCPEYCGLSTRKGQINCNITKQYNSNPWK